MVEIATYFTKFRTIISNFREKDNRFVPKMSRKVRGASPGVALNAGQGIRRRGFSLGGRLIASAGEARIITRIPSAKEAFQRSPPDL
jgi:hypothetical protein